MALRGFIRAVIIEKVSSTLRAPHETFMAWVVIVQRSMSSSFKRKSERLLLLLKGLSLFHLTVTVQCVLKGGRGKLNRHCEQIEVGGSPHHKFTDPLVEHVNIILKLCLSVSPIKFLTLRCISAGGEFVFQRSWLGECSSTRYPQFVY